MREGAESPAFGQIWPSRGGNGSRFVALDYNINIVAWNVAAILSITARCTYI